MTLQMERILAFFARAISTAARVSAVSPDWLTMSSTDFLYLGRGINYPIALEGALKLKEISYIHAEGYPAGEMKHGPIALIDEKMPVVVLAPRDRYFQKTVSNLKEVESRGGRVVVLTDDAKMVGGDRLGVLAHRGQ